MYLSDGESEAEELEAAQGYKEVPGGSGNNPRVPASALSHPSSGSSSDGGCNDVCCTCHPVSSSPRLGCANY